MNSRTVGKISLSGHPLKSFEENPRADFLFQESDVHGISLYLRYFRIHFAKNHIYEHLESKTKSPKDRRTTDVTPLMVGNHFIYC